MKNKEFIEYLKNFKEDAEVCFILANPKKRMLYGIDNKFVITDMDNPCICIEVGDGHTMDEELAQACEECEKAESLLTGQMEITDYPEVMP